MSPGAKLEEGGPRQPWHDIHSKIEGPVAWDVYTNFVQRWTCQSGAQKAELRVNVDDDLVFCPPLPVLDENDPSTWNVQLFRSIDSTSVPFPTDPETVLQKGLIRQHSHVVDRSIQVAPTLPFDLLCLGVIVFMLMEKSHKAVSRFTACLN